MIIVLHGEDTAASYERLLALQAQFKDSQKIWLEKKAGEQELKEAIFSIDLISSKKLVVAENYLTTAKKIPAKILESIPKDLVCIFWEKRPLTPAKISALKNLARVELFKPKTQLFTFLDNLVPNAKSPLIILAKLKDENLLWQLENRFLLLVLSKLNTRVDSAVNITKRNIYDWQWAKIKYQAAKFNLETLMALFSASLKIDLMIKSGKTNLPQNTLISMMLLKYLQ